MALFDCAGLVAVAAATSGGGESVKTFESFSSLALVTSV